MEKKNKFLNLKKNKKEKATVDDLTIEIEGKEKKKEGKTKKKKIGHKALIIILAGATAFVSFILVFAIYIILSSPDFDTDLLYNKEASVLTYKENNG